MEIETVSVARWAERGFDRGFARWVDLMEVVSEVKHETLRDGLLFMLLEMGY